MAETLPQSISEVLADYAHAYAALGFIPIPLKDKVPIISAWHIVAVRQIKRGIRVRLPCALQLPFDFTLPNDEASSQALWELLDEKRHSESQPWFSVSELDQRTSELITQSMEAAKC